MAKKIAMFFHGMNYGGSTVYLHIIGKELIKRGYEVTAICGGGERKEEFLNDGFRFINLSMVSIIENSLHDMPLKKRIKFIIKFFYYKLFSKIIFSRLKNYNILLCQQPFPSIVANIVSKNYNIPLINIVHHIISNEYTDIYGELNLQFDNYLAVSYEIQDMLETKGHNVIGVLENPIIFPQLKSIQNEQKDNYVVTLIGHIIDNKKDSVERFINAAVKLCEKRNNIIFQLAGPYNNPVGNKIFEDFRRRYPQLSKQVLFLGLIENINTVIDESDVVIGVGRSALEALAMNKQVILSGHVIGQNGGNYAGTVTKENFEKLLYNNFSGRSESLLGNCDLLVKDIEISLINSPEDIYNISKARLDHMEITNKLIKYIEGIK